MRCFKRDRGRTRGFVIEHFIDLSGRIVVARVNQISDSMASLRKLYRWCRRIWFPSVLEFGEVDRTRIEKLINVFSLSPTILITSKNIGPYFYDRRYRRIHFHKMHAYFNRGKSFLVSMSVKRIIVQVVRNM